MITVSNPTANQNSREAARAFADAGILDEFWTCLAFSEISAMCSIVPGVFRREMGKRALVKQVYERTRTKGGREFIRIGCERLGLKSIVRGEGAMSVTAVWQDLDRHVAKHLKKRTDLRAVYAYEDGAHATFTEARVLGLKTVYEHPVAYWRCVHELQAAEAERFPQWRASMTALADSRQKLERKDQEIELADLIIVPSTFSKGTLQLAPCRAPVEVVPYGCPPPAKDVRMASGARLRVLFVGHLVQSKGIGYVMEVAKRCGKHIDLTIVGKIPGDIGGQLDLPGEVRIVPYLPHSDLLALMRENDVLIHPSLHEGFGLVILEALSQGLCVIASTHTGAPDVISDGAEGFLIPPQSSEALEEKLSYLLGNRTRLIEMRRAALRCAAANSWERYGNKLLDVLRRHGIVPKAPENAGGA